MLAGYADAGGRRRRASAGAVRAVLRAMGETVDAPGDVSDALAARRAELRRRLLDPVSVAWSGRGSLRLRLPVGRAEGRARLSLSVDGQGPRRWSVDLAALPGTRDASVGAPDAPVRKEVPLPDGLPPGYHDVVVQVGGRRSGGLVVSAPERAPARHARSWGVFAPVYALRTERDWGVGDLTDLESLMRWIGGLGGGVVGTLPLTAAFLDEPFEPTPYSPASRLFWNELFVDPERAPELRGSAEARRRWESAGAQIAALRRARLVDYRRAMAVKRSVLEPMAEAVLARPSRRRASLEAFVESRREVERYARFRAAAERFRRPWTEWPAPQRDGRLGDGDVDPRAVRYHVYVQWLMEEQLATVAGGTAGAELSLDLPLGVNPAGYDVWRDPGAFARGASVGAPPDDFAPRGQDWGFAPPRPDPMRADGYRYFRASLAHLLRHAGVLRVDHVMALHRLFWVPEGMEPSAGVYVGYRPEELYAVLLLEAHRHDAAIVGEDLGTVPRAVRRAMDRHGVGRSYVVQTEARPDRRSPLPPVPRGASATPATHDMPTFRSFWEAADVDRREADGVITPRDARRERRRRAAVRRSLVEDLRRRGRLGAGEADAAAVLPALLADLAASPAGTVIPSLEDLWLEPESQNAPGTDDPANWRRKMRHPLERARSMRGVVGTLRSVAELRRVPRSP
ncbi:MAG TPA: 4-alpha-glucanotransferase [Actinomycetota bacterium]|nr:4-alpha-glucanotransferase [Actinomycetota bacterium]